MAHAFAIAQAMLRLFATPKTRPIFPAKTCSVIKKVKRLQRLQRYNGSADRKLVVNSMAGPPPARTSEALALQP